MRAANRPAPERPVGAPKGVAEGVLSASGPCPAAGPRVVGVLRIAAPARRDGTPSAESFCSCGRYETARGERAVAALVADHTLHRTLCPLQAEGRAAA
ncbi:hypothetical protein ACFY7C_29815 [Streptomyces sp. NPDC012769]|uniref:hypothetical protein n=1 Tax=Streptomyces sp. NPDC012769 TaxID=3364848 RepID=UPI0036C8F5C3